MNINSATTKNYENALLRSTEKTNPISQTRPPLCALLLRLIWSASEKALPPPANQWTLGMPFADVHIENRPSEVHQADLILMRCRLKFASVSSACSVAKKAFVANQKM